MKLVITAGEALDYGWWKRICDYKGMNVYAVNEGLMDRDAKIELSQDELQKLGVLTF